MKGQQHNKSIGNVEYMKYTSIKELNSLWTPWGPGSVRNYYNTLKKYFQSI